VIKMKAFTVTEITRYIKRIIGADPILNNVIVEGEISNFTRHSSGHCYFTLKDDQSKMTCVLFAKYVTENVNTLKNGDKVHAKGQITIFERDGKYQLYVSEIENIGLGALHIKFQLLKESLEKKGFFDMKYKKKLPELPKRIGVITSPTGAAIQDIISVAKRRSTYSELLIYPVRVQGEGSSVEIVRAIAYFNDKNPVDLIVLARGGGSIEELWSFNEENVAVAIFDSKIPIITGVGHETDFTISDFVADHRAPTPSAAAEIAVKSKEEIRLMINKSLQSIMLQVNRKVELKAARLERYSEKMLADLVRQYTDKKLQKMEYLHERSISTAKNFIAMERSRLNAYGTQLNALSPLGVLSRGYGIVSKDNVVIGTVEQLAKGDRIAIQFVDGKATGTVDSVEKSVEMQESEAEHGSKEK